ncbi:hypothetical protein LWI29_015221 [Acer saccharum]|uniref:Late embryogenesis abundant protein, LEA-18 n=1 Tax=Acer saccharum TaxID=4024 RepID=A0AA39VZM8_ACESA|nr:hypothetical protein LWI29_015221 [Acer saccharum]KAK1589547.1 hypothetical protein Q3G72_035168 [Acer saccharum]
MSNPSEQMSPSAKTQQQEKNETLEGLLMESSPYLKYTDLEDYKRQAYGTQGHLEVKPNQGGGGTDAPTLAGTGLTQGQAEAVDAANRQGIP